MAHRRDRNTGCLGAILWSILAVVGTLAGAGFLAWLKTRPEGPGMGSVLFLAPVLFGLWMTALAAIAVRFANVRSQAARIVAPLGCGCLSMVAVAVPLLVVLAIRHLLA